MKRLLLVILALVSICSGCQSGPAAAPAPKTSETASATRQHINTASVAVRSASGETAKLPETATKGAIAANLTTATTALVSADKSATATAAGAEADAEVIAEKVAEIQKLKANDPVRKGLQWLAWGAIAIGSVLMALHFFWLRLSWGDDAGGACLAVVAIIWTILAFERPIMFTIIVCAVGYVALKVWSRWRDSRKARKAVKA